MCAVLAVYAWLDERNDGRRLPSEAFEGAESANDDGVAHNKERGSPDSGGSHTWLTLVNEQFTDSANGIDIAAMWSLVRVLDQLARDVSGGAVRRLLLSGRSAGSIAAAHNAASSAMWRTASLSPRTPPVSRPRHRTAPPIAESDAWDEPERTDDGEAAPTLTAPSPAITTADLVRGASQQTLPESDLLSVPSESLLEGTASDAAPAKSSSEHDSLPPTPPIPRTSLRLQVQRQRRRQRAEIDEPVGATVHSRPPLHVVVLDQDRRGDRPHSETLLQRVTDFLTEHAADTSGLSQQLRKWLQDVPPAPI
ncbi:hypothetical protein CDCA_CDCA11G3301 [Cyanidium caldarium]|uniref:Uncharacterized protein n=1 Tax=Cyanidium caldarium TaxID=2771 RepID=A0AAV9IYQ4_CYACA|nr:hypothetical protein CDCA_CDCA11G3301 [Cyanidium caldarium]